MDIIFSLVIVVLFFSFTGLAITCMRHWQGVWRWAASIPVAALIVVILNILISTLLDRTSHNLWPLEIVAWSAGGLVYLGIIFLTRKIIAHKP